MEFVFLFFQRLKLRLEIRYLILEGKYLRFKVRVLSAKLLNLSKRNRELKRGILNDLGCHVSLPHGYIEPNVFELSDTPKGRKPGAKRPVFALTRR